MTDAEELDHWLAMVTYPSLIQVQPRRQQVPALLGVPPGWSGLVARVDAAAPGWYVSLEVEVPYFGLWQGKPILLGHGGRTLANVRAAICRLVAQAKIDAATRGDERIRQAIAPETLGEEGRELREWAREAIGRGNTLEIRREQFWQATVKPLLQRIAGEEKPPRADGGACE